jgi:hypothetical protein
MYKPRPFVTHSSLLTLLISISPGEEMLIPFMFMSSIHVQIFSALPYIPLHEGEAEFFDSFLPDSPSLLVLFLPF